jgi:hypothetical protein
LKEKSVETKALWLFSSGKKPIDVAVELDISASEVQNILEEFWALNDLRELAFMYNEIKTFLPSFLKLFHCLKSIVCWMKKISLNFSDTQIMIYLIQQIEFNVLVMRSQI